MKKGRFLWSAHRITERQKDGKARSIKGKQLKNSRNTVSKPPVALPSSPSDKKLFFSPENFGFPGFSYAFCCKALTYQNLRGQNPEIIDHNILRFVVKCTTILVVTI